MIFPEKKAKIKYHQMDNRYIFMQNHKLTVNLQEAFTKLKYQYKSVNSHIFLKYKNNLIKFN